MRFRLPPDRRCPLQACLVTTHNGVRMRRQRRRVSDTHELPVLLPTQPKHGQYRGLEAYDEGEELRMNEEERPDLHSRSEEEEGPVLIEVVRV